MNLKSLRLELSSEDISNKTIVQFYETIGKLFGIHGHEARYDCECILIAKNIQAEFYKAYEQLHPDEFAKNPEEFRTQVTMLLTNSGPKVEKTFSDNTVEIQKGFFNGRQLSSLIKTGLWKIAIVEDGYVRDTQIYTGDPEKLNDDNQEWENNFSDSKYPCQYIGIFEGESDDEICKKAAEIEGVHPHIISLIEMPL